MAIPKRFQPLQVPAEQLRLIGSAARLLVRRTAREWIGDDFTQPNRPIYETTFLGRPAWDLELKPPAHKPQPMQQVIDQATGLPLQNRSDGIGIVLDEWTEFTVGAPIDDDLFRWSGEVLTQAEQEAEYRRQHEARVEEGRKWFRTSVTDQDLTVELPIDLNLNYLRSHDDETGAFEASIGSSAVSGNLARRPKADAPWLSKPGERLQVERLILDRTHVLGWKKRKPGNDPAFPGR